MGVSGGKEGGSGGVAAQISSSNMSLPYLSYQYPSFNSTQLNVGGVFTYSGANITVSEAGIYRLELFSNEIVNTNAVEVSISIGLRVNSAAVGFSVVRKTAANASKEMIPVTFLAELNAGDIVSFAVRLLTDTASVAMNEVGAVLTKE